MVYVLSVGNACASDAVLVLEPCVHLVFPGKTHLFRQILRTPESDSDSNSWSLSDASLSQEFANVTGCFRFRVREAIVVHFRIGHVEEKNGEQNFRVITSRDAREFFVY